jgi:hypothetical protein
MPQWLGERGEEDAVNPIIKVGDVYIGPRHGHRYRVLRFEQNGHYDVVLWEEFSKSEQIALSSLMTEANGWRKEGAEPLRPCLLCGEPAQWQEATFSGRARPPRNLCNGCALPYARSDMNCTMRPLAEDS